MAVPNYTYLKLKMPGPKGVNTIKGSFEQAYYCEQDCVVQAAALVAPCARDGSGHDKEGAPVEEATKVAAVLDLPSIGEAPKASSSSGGSASPFIQALGPLEGADPIEMKTNLFLGGKAIIEPSARSDAT
jgi:hypothetical protein